MMDGYAVIARNTFGASSSNPITLRIVGNISTGDTPRLKLEEGEAIKIMTGAPSPEGADAVVKVEFTHERGGHVEVLGPVTPEKNISRVGEDVKKGDVILKKGQIIKPHDIGVLAATGNLRVNVRRRPKVKIASTGAELVEPGNKLRRSSIYDINSYTLFSLFEKMGCRPTLHGIIKDDEAEFSEVLESSGWDLLAVSGATSVGERDFVPDVIKGHGKIIFHGVDIRPGGPAGFAIIKDRPVFMLPGFPVACITAFELLVTPFIQKTLGTETASPHPVITGVLEKAVPSQLGRVDFVRVRVIEKDGLMRVSPMASKGAGLITTLTNAQGFIILEGKIEGIEAGEKVRVYLF
jgi:molybdenum cofactor synthesis domain-containing protein